MFGIEGRYAHALYSAASKKKSLESVEKELKEIQVRKRPDSLQLSSIHTINKDTKALATAMDPFRMKT